MSGGTQQATQTTKAVNPAGDSLIELGLPFAKQFAASPPQLPTGPLVAGFDPLQTQGQNMVLGATGAQGGIADIGKQLADFLSGDVLRPESNPALSATIDAATRPITETLTQSTLPAIRGAASTTGNFGSSRQGIAEGLASQGASRAVGDTGAKIATAGYQSGLDALLKNLALLPQTSNLQLQPGMTTSGVGDVRQAMTQAQLGETNTRSTFDDLLPLIMAQNLIGLGASVPTRETTATANQPTANPWMQGAGLGIAGLGALGGGSGIAALAPLLAFSDRRLKEDIQQIGELQNGTPVFRFRYQGQKAWQVGFMADSVPPETVTEILGFKAVDYSRVLQLAGAL